MNFDIGVNEALQRLSSPFFDFLNKAFSFLGTEYVLLAAALIIYWCFDKRYGYRFACVFFVGHTLSEVIKVLVARPRPYTYDSVRSIGEETHGWSFPSGHSHSIANLSAQLSDKTRKVYVYIIGGVATLLVMFSRVYLGQHFITDVLAGCAVGVLIGLFFGRLFDLMGEKEDLFAYIAAPLCFIVALVLYFTGVAGKNMLVALGTFCAFTSGYVFEKNFVRYDVHSDKIWKHIVKVVAGLAVAMGLRFVLKLIPIPSMFVSEFVRYFIVTAFAVVGAPALFKALKL